MIEWLALVVLVPLILLPLVLLLGFAGCNQIFGLDPTRVVSNSFKTARLKEEPAHPNQCIVQRIKPAALSAGGPNVRITVQRPTAGPLVINSMFISRSAKVTDPGADPYDAADDLTPVLTEPLELTPDPDQPLVELPEVDYDLDIAQPLLIAFDVGAEGTVPRTQGVVPNSEADAFLGPPPPPPILEASLADRQSGYSPDAHVYLIRRIDVISD